VDARKRVEDINVKLNRGPAKGRVFTLDDNNGPQDIVMVRTIGFDPKKREYWHEDHEYRRSHRKTRAGLSIYEWMGRIKYDVSKVRV